MAPGSLRPGRRHARFVVVRSGRRIDDTNPKGASHGSIERFVDRGGRRPLFAVERQADGVNLDALGIILMVVGGIGLVASVIRGSMLGFSATRRRRVSPDGSQGRRAGPAEPLLTALHRSPVRTTTVLPRHYPAAWAGTRAGSSAAGSESPSPLRRIL